MISRPSSVHFFFMTFSSRMRTFMMGDEQDNASRISGHCCRALAPSPSEKGGWKKTAGCTLSKGLGDGNQRSNSTSGKHKNVSRTYLRDSHFSVYPTTVPPFEMFIVSYGLPVLRCQSRESKASQLLLFLTKYRHSCIQSFS